MFNSKEPYHLLGKLSPSDYSARPYLPVAKCGPLFVSQLRLHLQTRYEELIGRPPPVST
jgi:hypothetical protein